MRDMINRFFDWVLCLNATSVCSLVNTYINALNERCGLDYSLKQREITSELTSCTSVYGYWLKRVQIILSVSDYRTLFLRNFPHLLDNDCTHVLCIELCNC